MNWWEVDPYVYAFIIIPIIFLWAFWKAYQMKKSFDSRGGSYDPIIPDLLKRMK